MRRTRSREGCCTASSLWLRFRLRCVHGASCASAASDACMPMLRRRVPGTPVALQARGAQRCEPSVSRGVSARLSRAPAGCLQDAQQRWPQQPPAWQPPAAGRGGPQWGPPGWRGPPGPYPPWGGPGRGGPFPGAMGYACRVEQACMPSGPNPVCLRSMMPGYGPMPGMTAPGYRGPYYPADGCAACTHAAVGSR